MSTTTLSGVHVAAAASLILNMAAACANEHKKEPRWPSPPPDYPSAPRGEGAAPPPAKASEPAFVQVGKATYYANSLAGNKTACGDIYDPKALTAAHKELAFGTFVRVTRTDTSRSVTVRINDRGPFAGRERIIDLSYRAAEQLDMLRAGVVPVRIEVVENP